MNPTSINNTTTAFRHNSHWLCAITFTASLTSAFDVNTIRCWVCEFTFVYNSDAAMMMVAQCSCNHSQLNIRSAANIQISPLDLPHWKAFRRKSWMQRLRLIPHESARVFLACLCSFWVRSMCREWVNENAVAMTERTDDARVRSGGQHWSITNWHPTSFMLICFFF